MKQQPRLKISQLIQMNVLIEMFPGKQKDDFFNANTKQNRYQRRSLQDNALIQSNLPRWESNIYSSV